MSQARLPLHRTARRDSGEDGRWKAIGKAWFDELNDAIREFHKLGTTEARAAFADSWIGIWARDFERAWPMVYELLRLIDEQKLYSDPRRVGPAAPGGKQHHGEQTYKTFAEYFTDRVGQPFSRWAELEATYRYVQIYAPEFFKRSYSEARELGKHGGDRRSVAAHDQSYPVTLKQRGNSLAYREAKAVRDEKPLAKRYEEKPLTQLRRAWKRASETERATFRAEIGA